MLHKNLAGNDRILFYVFLFSSGFSYQEILKENLIYLTDAKRSHYENINAFII